jgi:shikimate kinase
MATFNWIDEPELMARLSKAQNRPANQNIDIMTIVGCFNSREQLVRHVENFEAK